VIAFGEWATQGRQSKITWNAETTDLVLRKLVRLAAFWNLNKLGGQLWNKLGCDGCAGGAAGLIAVEEQDRFLEVLLEKVCLPARERASHQSNDARYPRLIHFEAVKETLHNDYTLAVVASAEKIEKDMRLAEAFWKLILWLSLTQTSSGVGHQSSILVVNRDHDPTGRGAFAGEQANSEVLSCLRADPAFRKVRVAGVNAG